ncbi:hypothetical protein [Nonomuraea sp. B19D2]
MRPYTDPRHRTTSPRATTLVIAIKVLTFVLPAVFTAWYPRRVRRALAR